MRRELRHEVSGEQHQRDDKLSAGQRFLVSGCLVDESQADGKSLGVCVGELITHY